MEPRFQFSLSRMFAATTCLALAAACLRFLFVEPRLFGLMALLAAAALAIGAAAVLAKGRQGLVMALVICAVSFGLFLFLYLFVYTLFFELPQDLRRQRGRRRVITMQPADAAPPTRRASEWSL